MTIDFDHSPLNFDAMSTREVLAKIAGEKPATELLHRFPTLVELSRAPLAELKQVPGIGMARAASLQAAFRLAERMVRESLPPRPLIARPEHVAELFRMEFRRLESEELRVVCLNRDRRLASTHTIAMGGRNCVHFEPWEVFRPAIAANSRQVVLVHNHPSGDPTPSTADIRATRDICRAGATLKIEVVDHIIFGLPTPERSQDYVSLRDLGHMNGAGC